MSLYPDRRGRWVAVEIRGLNFRDVREPDPRNASSGFTKCVIEFLNGDGNERVRFETYRLFQRENLLPGRGYTLKFRCAPVNIIVIPNVYLVVLHLALERTEVRALVSKWNENEPELSRIY